MPTIDLTYLETIADGENSIIIELVNIFLDQIDEFTEGFNTHFSNRDWKNIAAVAHKAKSSVISMGMTEFGEKDLKNLELISKYLLIKELENKMVKSSKENDDLVNLQKNLNGYPETKILWIKENASEEFVSSIIDKFKDICRLAKTDIEFFLENSNSDF